MSDRLTLIEERLQAALSPQDIAIVDDSAAHAGHPGARGGGGHFNVTIVSTAFTLLLIPVVYYLLYGKKQVE